MGSARDHAPRATRTRGYPRFSEINGEHPFQAAVPWGYVAYPARRRSDGRVVYFNFALAREMGLIDPAHPAELNPDLERAILDTFAIVIVNEYDRKRGVAVDPAEILPHPYMATRYLQLQHPDKRGGTSGDGRSVWNGIVTQGRVTWDVSSCGTGSTRLCPATAITGRHFKTGSRTASYGCGTASVDDGLSAALMSETLHRQGIRTERTLAVIALGDGYAINVRAGRNLLRPSHFFVHLKRGDLASLQGITDFFIARQVQCGEMPVAATAAARYRAFADTAARTFARTAATFEREYIFCWMDWDGDNILADGGIIDYGSVRQFGLYHSGYRYDDGPRWSTTIRGQRAKARLIVQTFAQARDFLASGRKRSIGAFAHDRVLKIFDREYADTCDRLLLRHVGFEDGTVEALLRRGRVALRRFERAHRALERAKSSRGRVKVPDGETWNAVYSTRDLLRELPQRYAAMDRLGPLAAEEVLRIGLATYASRRDRRPTPYRRRMARDFQRAYLALMGTAARLTGRSRRELLRGVAARAAAINPYARITGDGSLLVGRRLANLRHRVPQRSIQEVLDRLVERVTPPPGRGPHAVADAPASPDAQHLVEALLAQIVHNRHGL